MSEAPQSLVPPGFFGSVAAVTTSAQSRHQAETALAVGAYAGKTILMATYNDHSDTEATIVIDDGGDRHIHTGASLLGWSWSDDDGDVWHHEGKLAPPPGWAILWGDPSATTAKTDPRYVYIANIAAPSSKWPDSGVYSDGFGWTGTPLGGACIARSEDGGKQFSFPEHACIHNEKYQFYDGSSMAAGADGKIWAAFWLPHNYQLFNVWYADTPTGAFTMIEEPPFGGMAMESHPRIRVGADNKVVVAGLDKDGNLWMISGTPSGWDKPPIKVASGVAQKPTIPFTSPDGGTFSVRGGTEFSFDIGDASSNGDDAIRIAYVRKSDKHINVARCTATLSACVSDEQDTSWQYPLEGQRDPGYQWSPTMSFSPGVGGARGTWMMAFYSQERELIGDDEVVVLATEVRASGGSRSLGPIKLVAGVQRPCPTSNSLFWGDYNDMVPISPDPRTGYPRFVRGFSDSSGRDCVNETWLADPLHVSVVRFD